MSTIQGEGDYFAGRRFRQAQHRFAQHGAVQERAREAAEALFGPEARDLEDARQRAAKGQNHANLLEHVRRRGQQLDERLDQTYPASDPAPIYPGPH